MAQFRFKLQAVLKHRKSVENQRLRDFSAAQARCQAVQDQIQELNRMLLETNDDVRRNRLVGRLDVTFISAHRRFLMGMQRKGTELVQVLTERKKEADVARLALAEAARQFKVLEKLREKQEQRWKEDLSRKELAQLDEVGMQLGYEQVKAELARLDE